MGLARSGLFISIARVYRRGELQAFKQGLSGGLFVELSPCGEGVTERQMG